MRKRKNSEDIHEEKIISLSEKTKQIEVLTLGSFHFNFPNLDVEQTTEEDQIHVLKPKYQKEIKTIVVKLEKFKPTILAIEHSPKHQERYDSLYTAYIKDIHKLIRSE